MAAPSLYQILADVSGQLTALFGAAVSWDYTADARWANAAPPRVVWVPISESFGPADVSTYYPAKNVAAARAQRAIATRISTIEAHIWAAAAAQPPATSHDDHDAVE